MDSDTVGNADGVWISNWRRSWWVSVVLINRDSTCAGRKLISLPWLATQKKIIDQLRLVFANQAERRLEFINPCIGDDQIKKICLGKITASDLDRDFSSYWQTCGSEAGRQIILIRDSPRL